MLGGCGNGNRQCQHVCCNTVIGHSIMWILTKGVDHVHVCNKQLCGVIIPYNVSYRSLSGVRGLTRETLVTLTTTIESREWMRTENGLLPEHPRSSSTDDIECFFSILRNTIGVDFTTKKVMLEWRKICQEFAKRVNPELPFFYYTAMHDRFYECDRC